MYDFCENCNPHSWYQTTAVGECWLMFGLQKHLNQLCSHSPAATVWFKPQGLLGAHMIYAGIKTPRSGCTNTHPVMLYIIIPGDHSHTKVVRMLVIKSGVKGSIFGLVASSTFLENRVLFRLSFDVQDHFSAKICHI